MADQERFNAAGARLTAAIDRLAAIPMRAAEPAPAEDMEQRLMQMQGERDAAMAESAAAREAYDTLVTQETEYRERVAAMVEALIPPQ